MKNYWLFIFFSVFTYSQQNYTEFWYSADSEHLPQNSVKYIVCDKYGFIWMTTENGLVRYDGNEFKTFNLYNSDIKNNRMLYFEGSKEADSIFTYTELMKQKILIHNRTILVKDKFNSLKNPYNFSNNKYGFDSKILENKPFEFQLNYTLKYKFDKKTITIYNKTKRKQILHYLNTNNHYFFLNNDLYCLFPNGKYLCFNTNYSNNLIVPKGYNIYYNNVNKQTFLYTNNSIYEIKKATNKIYLSKIISKSEPFNFDIYSLYFDHKSNKLYVGSSTKGLGVFSLNFFHTLTDTHENNYYAIHAFNQNEIITGNSTVFNNTKLLKHLGLNPKNYPSTSIAIDRYKNIWLKNGNHLNLFTYSTQYKKKKTYTFRNEINTIYCDSHNTIWIGLNSNSNTKINSICYFNNAANLNPHYLPLKSNFVNYITETKDELIVSSKNSLQFYHFQKKHFKEIKHNLDIRSVFVCDSKKIWLCTYSSGFYLLENNRLIQMPLDVSKSLLSSHCILEDAQHHFWISTNKGLIEVSKKDLLRFSKNQKKSVYYHLYEKSSGFLTNEFNGGCQPCGLKLKDQNFYFPSLNGIVTFNPKKIIYNLPKNDFFLNEIELDSIKKRINNDTIEVPRNFERIKLKVDYSYFGLQKNIVLDALLKIDGKGVWTPFDSNKSITFTNLPPGTHTLYIRKLEGFDLDYRIKKFTIIVPYLFYERTIFKIIVFIFIVSLSLFLIKYRYNTIKKRNEILKKIIAEKTVDLENIISNLMITKNNLRKEIIQQKKLIGTVSHDIKSPLRFLTIAAKDLNDKIKEEEDIKNSANILVDSSTQLYRFVENLVDYSKIFLEQYDDHEKANIDTIFNDKITLFTNFAHSRNNRLTYKNESEEEVIENKKIISVIAHNLIDNAIKNTCNGTIEITVYTQNKKIYFEFTDSGFGMNKEKVEYYMNLHKNYENTKLVFKNHGIGLFMIIELINLIHGDFKISSQLNQGTSVTIILDQKSN